MLKLDRTEKKIFLTIWIFALFFVSHYGGSYMADSMLSLTRAIVDHGVIYTDDYVKEGCKISGCDESFHNGHWYSGFAPGPSFIALPAYIILKPFTYFMPDPFLNRSAIQITTIILNILGTYLVNSLLAALSAILIYRITGYLTKKRIARIITSLTFIFGTIMLYYVNGFDARLMSAFFAFASFYNLFMFKHKEHASWRLFAAGLLAGISFASEYQAIFIIALISLYALSILKNKKILYYMLGISIPILLVLFYDYAAFGSPLSSPYANRAGHEGDDLFNNGYMGFGVPKLSSLYLYTFSPMYGIFFYMPIIILIPIGLYFMLKDKKLVIEAILVGAVLILYLSMYSMFKGFSPMTWGPRYFNTIIPFMIIPISICIEKIKLRYILPLILAGFLLNILPVMYMVESPTQYITEEYNGWNTFNSFIKLIPQKGLSNYTLNLINQEITKVPIILGNAIVISFLIFYLILLYKIWNIEIRFAIRKKIT